VGGVLAVACAEDQSQPYDPYASGGDSAAPIEWPIEDAGSVDEASPAVLANPVYPSDCADPHVFYDDGKWHAFCTQIGINVTPHLISSDLQTWTLAEAAVKKTAAWVEFGQNWAPSVAKFGTSYVLYYSAKRKNDGQHCLGRAIASAINGPYVDDLAAPWVCRTGGYWSLDPTTFTAPDGKRYLLWRQDTASQNKGNVAIRQLSDDGTSFASGSEEKIILSKQNGTWEDPVMENPAMAFVEGKYWLFYSANAWDTASYGIGYAECVTPTGPCSKKTAKAPWLGSIFALSGPGGEDFFVDGSGGLWMSMHGWTTGKVGYDKGGARSLWMFRFGLKDGSPHLFEAVAPLQVR